MTDGPDRCIFCAIAAGAAEASVVRDDGDVLAFMDIAPANPGHVLVIPRVHAVGLGDLDAATGARVWTAAQAVARAVRTSGLRCEGVNLFLADGAVAGQEVFHVHLHVIPRFAGDGVVIRADQRPRDRAELDDHATAVRRALAELS
jgi:histidine triad (HIT) family protein